MTGKTKKGELVNAGADRSAYDSYYDPPETQFFSNKISITKNEMNKNGRVSKKNWQIFVLRSCEVVCLSQTSFCMSCGAFRFYISTWK